MRFISNWKEEKGHRSESSPIAEAERVSLGVLFRTFLKIGSLAFTGVLLGSQLCGRRPDQSLCIGMAAILAVSGEHLL